LFEPSAEARILIPGRGEAHDGRCLSFVGAAPDPGANAPLCSAECGWLLHYQHFFAAALRDITRALDTRPFERTATDSENSSGAISAPAGRKGTIRDIRWWAEQGSNL
jgi:hypothetical protein